MRQKFDELQRMLMLPPVIEVAPSIVDGKHGHGYIHLFKKTVPWTCSAKMNNSDVAPTIRHDASPSSVNKIMRNVISTCGGLELRGADQ